MSRGEFDIRLAQERELDNSALDKRIATLIRRSKRQGTRLVGPRDLVMAEFRLGNIADSVGGLLEKKPIIVINPANSLPSTTLVDETSMTRIGVAAGMMFTESGWMSVVHSVGNHHVDSTNFHLKEVNSLVSLSEYPWLNPLSAEGQVIWSGARFYLKPIYDEFFEAVY